MKEIDFTNLKELTSVELKTYSGGEALLWFFGGFIFGEVMQGIYQAQKRGCLSKN